MTVIMHYDTRAAAAHRSARSARAHAHRVLAGGQGVWAHGDCGSTSGRPKRSSASVGSALTSTMSNQASILPPAPGLCTMIPLDDSTSALESYNFPLAPETAAAMGNTSAEVVKTVDKLLADANVDDLCLQKAVSAATTEATASPTGAEALADPAAAPAPETTPAPAPAAARAGPGSAGKRASPASSSNPASSSKPTSATKPASAGKRATKAADSAPAPAPAPAPPASIAPSAANAGAASNAPTVPKTSTSASKKPAARTAPPDEPMDVDEDEDDEDDNDADANDADFAPAKKKGRQAAPKPTTPKQAKTPKVPVSGGSGARRGGRAPAAAAAADAEASAAPVVQQPTGYATSERLLELLDGVDPSAGVPSRADVRVLSAEVRAVSDASLQTVPTAKLGSALATLNPLLLEAAADNREASGRKTKNSDGASSSRAAEDGDADGADGDDGDEGDDDESGGAAERTARALEASLLLLNVVTVPKMPMELLVEESLEAVLLLARRSLAKLHKAAANPKAPTAQAANEPRAAGGGKGARGKAPARARQPTAADAASPSTDATLTLLLERMPPLASFGLSDSLTHLLTQLGLSAAFGLATTAAPSGAVKGLRGSLPLQMAGMRVLLAVFNEHAAHRRGIVGEVLDAYLGAALPPNREQRRNYALPDGARVQLFTALCLLLVQTSARLPSLAVHEADGVGGALGTATPDKPDKSADADDGDKERASAKGKGSSAKKRKAGGGKSPAEVRAAEVAAAEAERKKAAAAKEAAAKAAAAKAAAEHPWLEVQKLLNGLLRAFTSRCLDRPDDAEHRAALEDFVRDVLVLAGRPEWPAAHMAAERLGTLFCQRLNRDTAKDKGKDRDKGAEARDAASRTLALDQLGVLLAALFEHKRKHAEAPLVFPAPKEDVDDEAQPNDPGEVSSCICGVAYDASSSGERFMLDCDLCHRWFHGACVGVGKDQELELWYCDHCRLSTAVTDQRQRIARLLALPCADAPAADDDDGGSAGGGAGRGDVSMGEVGALCTETETTKQLLLNFLQANALADVAADVAQTHVLCEWHHAALDGGRSLLCDLYNEQGQMVGQARERARLAGGEPVDKARALLSRIGILSAGRRLMAESKLFSNIDVMLSHLLAVLRDTQPAFRVRAVKALRDIVRNPSIPPLGEHTSTWHTLLTPDTPVVTTRAGTRRAECALLQGRHDGRAARAERRVHLRARGRARPARRLPRVAPRVRPALLRDDRPAPRRPRRVGAQAGHQDPPRHVRLARRPRQRHGRRGRLGRRHSRPHLAQVAARAHGRPEAN